VLLISAVPHTTTALGDSYQLIGNSVGQLCVTTLFRCIQNPLDRGTAALAEVEGVGNLHGSTTTSNTLLLANAEERSHRIDDASEVEDRVKGQLRSRSATHERTTGVDVRRRGGTEVVENDRHVLRQLHISLLSSEENPFKRTF
jgi:hypothetical protein